MHLITVLFLFLLSWSWFIIICFPISVCLAYFIMATLSSFVAVYLAVCAIAYDKSLRKDYLKVRAMYRLFVKFGNVECVMFPSIILSASMFAIVLITNLFYYNGEILRNFPRLNTPSFSDTAFIFFTVIAPFYFVIFAIFGSVIYCVYKFYVSFSNEYEILQKEISIECE